LEEAAADVVALLVALQALDVLEVTLEEEAAAVVVAFEEAAAAAVTL